MVQLTEGFVLETKTLGGQESPAGAEGGSVTIPWLERLSQQQGSRVVTISRFLTVGCQHVNHLISMEGASFKQQKKKQFVSSCLGFQNRRLGTQGGNFAGHLEGSMSLGSSPSTIRPTCWEAGANAVACGRFTTSTCDSHVKQHLFKEFEGISPISSRSHSLNCRRLRQPSDLTRLWVKTKGTILGQAHHPY